MTIVYHGFKNDLEKHNFLAKAILTGMNMEIAETDAWKQRGELEFDFKINGIEHDVTIFLKRLEEQLEQDIEIRARRIVENKFASLLQTVSDFECAFKEQTENILSEGY